MNKTNETLAKPQSFSPHDVQITGGFWKEKMDVNRRATLPIVFRRCEETGRIDALKQNWKPGDPNKPHIFWDSDVAKLIEGCCYSLAAHPDAALEAKVDEVIALFAAAQQSDGYLNSYYTTVEPENRWTNLRDNHELYCAGHIIEAAVAHFQCTGKRTFLDVACRYADYIATVFGRGKGRRRGYPGHEEIELALVRLYYVTEESRYRDLAEYFVNERGQTPHYYDQEAVARGEAPKDWRLKTYAYCQAHVPVREQKKPVGHAVRATYLYTGMAAVAGATGDASLLKASRQLWRAVTTKQMHVTGGIGQIARNEGFTTDYDLPNESAYLETCAAIGMALWGRGMLDWEPDSTYSDVVEQALYNGVISGVSSDGRRFFYGNPLASHPGFDGNGNFVREGYYYRRQEWFGCSCCPTNIARTVSNIPSFLYTSYGDELAVHQYAESVSTLSVGGQSVEITQKTDYPWDGSIALEIKPEKTAAWRLSVRIPGWCRSAVVKVNGKKIKLATAVSKGYARIQREWRAGDVVKISLAMPVDCIQSHPAVRQNGGRVALRRGPVVYCLESIDNGANLNSIALRADPVFEVVPGKGRLLDGVPIIRAEAVRAKQPGRADPLYGTVGTWPRVACKATAIPYFLWGNRSSGEMLVWMRQS
ncbi:MAG: glycoside hydrolase family 127 protein [Kiritimatiellia bacterium]|jgi:DUF1680 family protein